MRLNWDQQPSQLPYDPLLITCFEGLIETEHPFLFVARQGCRELLTADGAADKAIPLIPRLVMPLRVALMNSDSGIFAAALEILKYFFT